MFKPSYLSIEEEDTKNISDIVRLEQVTIMEMTANAVV